MRQAIPPATASTSRSLGFAGLLAVSLAALGLGLFAGFRPASAHAAYEESEPPFAAVLEASPERILLRFTQELFRREGANTITLTNLDTAAPVRLGQIEIANQDRHVMSAAVLESLTVGRYEVAWTNLSAEDGDADTGAYPFYVGREPTAAEVESDRETAIALLITYPGDKSLEVEDANTAVTVTPTVVRGANDSEAVGGGIGLGVWIWLAIGVVAAGGLLATLRRSRGGLDG